MASRGFAPSRSVNGPPPAKTLEAWKARLDRILRAVLTNHEAEGAQFRPQDERGPARDLQHLHARVRGQEGAVKAVDGPPLLPEGEPRVKVNSVLTSWT